MQIVHSIHSIDTPVGARGTTVRRGGKWYGADFGEGKFELCVCSPYIMAAGGEGSDLYSHHIVGHARLFSRALVNFSTLTDDMLADEHEEASRNVEGLLESMRRAYGPEFSKDELVTVLNYWRLD